MTHIVSGSAFAQESAAIWSSSDAVLETKAPEAPQRTVVAFDLVKKIILRSLKSQDQARELLKLHGTNGTQAVATSRGILSPLKMQKSPS